MYMELAGRTGLSRRKLVLTKDVSNNLHLAQTENKWQNKRKRKKREIKNIDFLIWGFNLLSRF